jgi:hypothetical protein
MQCAGKETRDNNPDLGLMFQSGAEKGETNIMERREKECLQGSRVLESIRHCMNCGLSVKL